MTATLRELASLVGGTIEGDADTVITGANPIDQVAAGEITLIDSETRLDELQSSCAAAVVVSDVFAVDASLPQLRVADVHAAFTEIVRRFRPPRQVGFSGVHPQAIVSPSATIGAQATIGPLATIGDDVVIGPRVTIHPGVHVGPGVTIGEDVTIHSGVVLYPDVRIGDRVTIHAAAVIGSYGFGYRFENGQHVRAAQLGSVEIQADVEVGAGVTIDRGTYGATVVGAGTKIDNLVQIAHNCRLGRHNLICSQVGIAGSTSTGDSVVMAGQVGVRDHVHIGDRAVLTAMAGIANDVPEGATMMGIPATPIRDQKLKQAALAKLVQMRREFKRVQRRLAELTEQLETTDGTPDDSNRGECAA